MCHDLLVQVADRPLPARPINAQAPRTSWRVGFIEVALAGAMAGAGYLHQWGPAVLAGLLILVFAHGWPPLIYVPSRRGGPIVIALTGLVALCLIAATHNLAWAAIAMGFGVMGAFIHQMMREPGRKGLVESVAGIVTGCTVALCASGWVALTDNARIKPMLYIGLASLAAAALAAAAPLPGVARNVLTVGAGAAAGAAVSGPLLQLRPYVEALLPFAPEWTGLVTGALTGAVIVILRTNVWTILYHRHGGFKLTADVAAALVLPVLVLGLPFYAVARAVTG